MVGWKLKLLCVYALEMDVLNYFELFASYAHGVLKLIYFQALRHPP
jgi:hypothetical protein